MVNLPTRAALIQRLLNPPPSNSDNVRSTTGSPVIYLPAAFIYPTPDWRMVFSIPYDIYTLREYRSAFGCNRNVLIRTEHPKNFGAYLIRAKFPLKTE